MLLETVMDYFVAMRKKRAELEKKSTYVEDVIRAGAAKASAVAGATMGRVRKAVGLG